MRDISFAILMVYTLTSVQCDNKGGQGTFDRQSSRPLCALHTKHWEKCKTNWELIQTNRRLV